MPESTEEKIKEDDMVEIPKPWGRELLLSLNDNYAVKILEVKEGGVLSLQYHEKKHETLFVLEGKAEIVHGDHSFVAERGRVIVVPPNTVHRVTAEQFTRIFEVSTPEIDDVVRLEDIYGRQTIK